MTTKNHASTDVEHEDELIVQKLLLEMVQDERWELTDLGRQRLHAGNENHQHRLVIWPFGKQG